jgi:choline kinase
MKAIILAAGVGKRLGSVNGERQPKCLLEIDGKSLLQRHFELLERVGITDNVLVLGYAAQQIATAIEAMKLTHKPTLMHNPDYQDGSIVSLWTAREHLTAGEDILLMDADVLYDQRMLERLTSTLHVNCFLLDRHFEAGTEPVKLCVNQEELVEFRKQIAADLTYDYQGESVGFFRFSAAAGRQLAAITQSYVDTNREKEPHEEAIRDFLLQSPSGYFNFEDVTGLPWIEIDFPEDVKRAEQEILPQLQQTSS